MALSPGDVERWDAVAVRDVATALGARGASAGDVRAGLSRLPMVESWQGSSGEAARAALDRLGTDLAAHGLQMARLSSATAAAADEIERLQDGLRSIESDCRHEGFAIDMATGAITPRRPDMVGDPIYAWQQAALDVRIKALLDAADAADAELARAISDAGAAPAAPPTTIDVLAMPLPLAAADFREFWEPLTNEQKDLLYRRDDSIGNRDGMPAIDRDYYNRLTLTARTDRATAAPGDASRLADLEAVARAADGADRLLLVLDTAGGAMTHAAIAIGNPDTADHVSVTAPGLNTTVRASLPKMAEDAADLRRESLRQLRNAPGHALGSVSTVAWLGYDPPQIADIDDVGAVLDGGWDVSHGQVAAHGAHALAGFYDGLAAGHRAVPLHLSAIGHSYGSLTTGLALQLPGDHGVDDVVFYGSPGVGATTPGELQVPDGHVFTMQTPDDPIRHVFDTPLLHAGATMLPAPFDAVAESVLRTLLLTGAGQFGPDPATNPNFTRLETGPATVADGAGRTVSLAGAGGHSEYADFDGDGRPRTTCHNLAAVVAGLPANLIRE